MDLSGTQLKKWVINISKYKLRDKETALLAKGLNFAITQDKVPHDDYIHVTELAGSEIIMEAKRQVKAGTGRGEVYQGKEKGVSLGDPSVSMMDHVANKNHMID